jgi:carboxymethylenebutenolidase
MALREYIAGEIAEDFSDGRLTRREAIRRLVTVGLTVSSAAALLAACGGDDDGDGRSGPAPSSSRPPATGARPRGGAVEPAELIRFQGPNGELQAAWATPAQAKGGVLLVHEIFGLTEHFYDLASRFAGEGYGALAVDLLSAQGGTPAAEGAGGTAGGLAGAPLDQLLGDLGAGIDELERRLPGVEVAVIGFCFGGGMVWNLLNSGEERLAAAVPFYGPAPADADFSGSEAAVLAVYGENDERVNATRDAATAALEAAGLTHEVKTYPEAGHGFFNDTGPNYNEQAATEANAAVLDWLDRHLQ